MLNLYTKLTNKALFLNWYFVFFGQQMYVYTEWHKKTGTFEKPNKNWRNPRKKIYWQKL